MALFPVLPMNVTIIIVAIAMVYVVASVFVQRKLSNPKKMRYLQARIKGIQGEFTQMMKSNAPKEQINAKQMELLKHTKESMQNSMKPMIVIFPMLLIFEYALLPSLPLGVSVASMQSMFFWAIVILGLASSVVIMLYDRKKMKEEMVMMSDPSLANAKRV